MRKGYTDGRPWHGNQVWAGPVLIHGYSESGRDIVIQVAHIGIGVGAEWRRSGSGQGWMEAECGRRLPKGVDKGETKGKRARGRSYHDITVRARPRPGAYTTSGYLRSSDVSTRGHSRGMDPC